MHLATHAASRPVRRIFSSDLQRAASTAQAIAGARQPVESQSLLDGGLSVLQVPDLRERDFRSSEGQKFGSRAARGPTGNPHPDAETHAEMAIRVDRFIDTHLVPIFSLVESSVETIQESVVVVAHGIILNVLLRCLLTRYAPAELVRLVKPAVSRPDWLVSWSNTGYLEAVVFSAALNTPRTSLGVGTTGQASTAIVAGAASPTSYQGVQISILAINCIDHLRDLKRTRGGIGSAEFDSKQRTVDSFFKPSSRKENA